ncbi:MAG: hypothetical protein LCH63_18870 [Candidatus Melainabacteria bacterium]|jgi:hypothetical protein|nr:hypothetical protein [Candidatus Melainabacteria bacterium]
MNFTANLKRVVSLFAFAAIGLTGLPAFAQGQDSAPIGDPQGGAAMGGADGTQMGGRHGGRHRGHRGRRGGGKGNKGQMNGDRKAKMLKRFDSNGDGVLDDNEKQAMKQAREARRAQRQAMQQDGSNVGRGGNNP